MPTARDVRGYLNIQMALVFKYLCEYSYLLEKNYRLILTFKKASSELKHPC